MRETLAASWFMLYHGYDKWHALRFYVHPFRHTYHDMHRACSDLNDDQSNDTPIPLHDPLPSVWPTFIKRCLFLKLMCEI
jgi:hypothetical protein